MFVRDYHSFGLYAKASVNPSQPNVITFQLVGGSGFGSLNVVAPSASFSFAGSGFGSSSATTADIGVATLTINGTVVATSSYGSGSTAASIAQDLSSQAASNSGSSTPVAVTSEGPNLYLQVKQPTGSYSDSYSLTFSTNVSFSTSTPASGTLNGSTDVAPITVYSYSIANPSGGTGYAANGNVNYLNDSVMGNWSYNYDNLNRLTSGTASGGAYNGDSACWSYDSFGNRTNQIVSNALFTTANGPLCQPASGATNRASAATYQAADNHMTTTPQLPNGLAGGAGTWPNNGIYDLAGNVVNDGANQYTYDAEGKVCALNGPQGMIGYQYDADGNRVGKGTVTNWQSCDLTANGYQPMTDFVLDQSGGQMTEMAVSTTSSGTTYTHVHSNVTAGGALIASFDSLYNQHFYLTDALGSRRVQTDPAGIPEQTCQSLPFGDQLYCTGGSLTTPTEHHFTGKERDAESGLDDLGARYFASAMGRFMSPDIVGGDLGNPQSLNRYAYALNNPLVLTDPSGFDPQQAGCSTVSTPGNGQMPAASVTTCPAAGNGGSGTTPYATGQTFGGVDCGLCDAETAPVEVSNEGADSIDSSAALAVGQAALDTIGMVPGPVGMVANVASAGISIYDGNYGAAALSLAFAVPVVGQLGKGAIRGLELGEGGFKTFEAFKAANPAAEGMHWHHVVGQTASNIERFGPGAIHNIENLVQVPRDLHIGPDSISAYYSSIQEFTNGQTVRQWLSPQSFAEQRDFGLLVLRHMGLP